MSLETNSMANNNPTFYVVMYLIDKSQIILQTSSVARHRMKRMQSVWRRKARKNKFVGTFAATSLCL